MKLSIIVPVYNVAGTLGRCVSSLLAQGIDDYEILLVDDGSTDGSGGMADAMAAGNGRIRAFHKPNGGLSDARNYGIERATGDYITFVDSDDFLREGTYAALAAMACAHPGYDIIEYPVTQKPGYPDQRLFNPGEKVYRDALDWLSEYGLEHCWAWNKIYRRWLFGTVRFPVGKTYEDMYAMADIVRLKPVVATTGAGMYYYCWNSVGIGAAGTAGGLTSLLEAQVSLTLKLGLDTRRERWHRLYLDMFTSQLYAYRKTGRITLWPQRIRMGRYSGRKDFIKAAMLNIFGLRLSCRIFRLLTGRWK